MGMFLVGVDDDVIARRVLADKIPELPADQQFIIGKELPHAFLSPRLAFSKSVIGSSKIAFDIGGWSKLVCQDGILLEDGFFF